MSRSRYSIFFLILGLAASGILLAAADFGESSTSLGQFTDDFTDLNNVSVRVLIERNATLNAMELNFTAVPPITYENFTEYTEVDSANDLTISDRDINWVTMRRDAASWVVYDFGVDYFGDFSVDFTLDFSDIEAGDASNRHIMGIIVFSNTVGTVVDLAVGDVLVVLPRQAAGSDDVYRYDLNQVTGGVLDFAISDVTNYPMPKHYGTLERSGTTITLRIYTDEARTALIETLTSPGNAQKYRYFSGVISYDSAGDGADHSSGLVANVTFLTVGGYVSEGYFTTEDYLNYANGSTLVLMTEADIPAGTSMTVEFSSDNATWVNQTAISEGRDSIDLRFLNWSSSFFLNYSLSTGDSTITPRLNQSRLITTIGAIGAGAPGLNVSREWIEYNLTEIGVTVGTLDSGNLNSTLDIDGDTYNVSEVVGAPGIQVSGNFSGVDPDAECLWIVIYAHYDGNLNHDFDIEVWNFTGSAWVEDGHITDGAAFSWFNSTIYPLRIPNEFLSGGEVRVRLDHESPGNINHDLFIEYFKLLAEIPAGPTPGAGAVTVNVFESDFPWIAIAIILMCVAYLLLRPK